jgi:hypothetical protein
MTFHFKHHAMAKFILKMRPKDRDERDRDRRIKAQLRRKIEARFNAMEPDETHPPYAG